MTGSGSPTALRFVPLVGFLLLTQQSAGQIAQDSSRPLSRVLAEDGCAFVCDLGGYFISPLQWGGKDWALAAGLVGGTVLAMTADGWVHDRVSLSGDAEFRHDFWDVPTVYGSTLVTGGASIGTYIAGLAFGSEDVRVAGRLMITSVSAAFLTSQILKIATGRSRPYTGNTQWDFRWFETEEDQHSFPSGHATAAFAISTVLAERIDKLWARVAFYGMASLTAVARVRNNQHWASDVLAGAAIGITAGFYALAQEESRIEGTGTLGGLQIGLSPVCITLVYRFE